MVNFNLVDYKYSVRWQFALVNTKEILLFVITLSHKLRYITEMGGIGKLVELRIALSPSSRAHNSLILGSLGMKIYSCTSPTTHTGYWVSNAVENAKKNYVIPTICQLN